MNELERTKQGILKASLANALATELLGVVLIGYGFLTDFPWPVKILIAMTVTLFLCGLDRIYCESRYGSGVVIGYLENEVKKDIWFETLTMRFALDDLLNQLKAGTPLKFDWTTAMQRATEDIHLNDRTIEIQQKYRPDRSNEPGFFFTIVGIIINILVRGGAGYGLAWLAQTYTPNLVHSII